MFESLFRNTLAPWQWAVMAAVPPAILALYFLKLKRVPVEVPSTYLWAKTIEDLHVNSLWQRLRKSVLLLLQLLLVALAMLALLRPGWQGTRLTGERFIFLVDNSASMGATDAEDADNRLAAAKRAVLGLVDQLEPGMSAMVISYAGQARVVQDFTENKRLLREATESIRLTAEPTNLLEALKLAEGLADPAQLAFDESLPEVEVVDEVEAGLFLLTDGRGGKVDFTLGRLEAVFVPVGSTESANLAITAMSTRRIDASSLNDNDPERAGEQQAYVQVSNLGQEDARVVVDLSHTELGNDWRLLDAQQVTVPAGESAGLTFPLADTPPGKLRATLAADSLLEAGDRLALDNTAYAALNNAATGRVLLVSTGSPEIETALATGRAAKLCKVETLSPSSLKSKEHQTLATSGAYDLIIYDRCTPEVMPRANTLFLGAVPPLDAWRDQPAPTQPSSPEQPAENVPSEAEWIKAPIILDWNRSHPLLAYVEFSNLLIARAVKLTPPPSAARLIDSDSGPLLAVAPRDSYEDAVLALPILIEEEGDTAYNTNWFTKRSFPTFWLNTLAYFVGEAGTPGRSQTLPGRSIEVRLTSDVRQVTVVTPTGERQRLSRVGDEPFQYQQTTTPGVYEVLADGPAGEQIATRFAVNLFSREESDIRLREREANDPQEAQLASLQIGFVDVQAAANAAPERKELWRWLLLAGLAVLLAEWYVYNRRVHV